MTKPGYGTINNPMSLTAGLGGDGFNFAQPGDTIYLRGGTYSGMFTSYLNGTAENPITVMPYNNEHVVIDGDFSGGGQYIRFVDIEFTSTYWSNYQRIYTGDYPTSDVALTGCEITGLGNAFINCTFHDCFLLGVWGNAKLLYGSITYNHGLFHSGTPYGHSCYFQNDKSTGRKLLKHNVFGRSANCGAHGYATGAALEAIDFVENVLLPNNTHLIGSQKADADIVFTGNHSWSAVVIGYGAHDKTLLTMTGNILYNPNSYAVQINKWISGEISGNVFVTGTPGGADKDIIMRVKPAGVSALTVDNNTYYSRSGKAACFGDDGQPVPWKTLAQWQAEYGYDLNSTIDLTGASPADSVHVYPNEYEAISKRKGMIVIHNWTEAESVMVDLSTIAIDAGQSYRLMQAQDPLVDMLIAVMPESKQISIDMRAVSHTVAGVAGWTDPAQTFPAFGAFVIECVT